MADDLTPSQWDEIRSALAHGDKIAAIKLYRTISGCDLVTAKQVIENLADGKPTGMARRHTAASELSAEQWDTIKATLASSGKIAAIRCYRGFVGCDLVTAKNVIDRLDERTDQMMPDIQRRSGCFGILIVALGGLGAGAYGTVRLITEMAS